MRIIINKKTYYWFPLQEKISVGTQTSVWSNLKEKLEWGWLGGKCRVTCSAKLQIIQGEIYEKEKLRKTPLLTKTWRRSVDKWPTR